MYLTQPIPIPVPYPPTSRQRLACRTHARNTRMPTHVWPIDFLAEPSALAPRLDRESELGGEGPTDRLTARSSFPSRYGLDVASLPPSATTAMPCRNLPRSPISCSAGQHLLSCSVPVH